MVAGLCLPALADVTKLFHWGETGLEPGHTARVWGPMVTWPPSQTKRRMSWSTLLFLMLVSTGWGELMLPQRGRGSGVTAHPGDTPTGVEANLTIIGAVNTILASEQVMASGRMSQREIFFSFVSIEYKKILSVHYHLEIKKVPKVTQLSKRSFNMLKQPNKSCSLCYGDSLTCGDDTIAAVVPPTPTNYV